MHTPWLSTGLFFLRCDHNRAVAIGSKSTAVGRGEGVAANVRVILDVGICFDVTRVECVCRDSACDDKTNREKSCAENVEGLLSNVHGSNEGLGAGGCERGPFLAAPVWGRHVGKRRPHRERRVA